MNPTPFRKAALAAATCLPFTTLLLVFALRTPSPPPSQQTAPPNHNAPDVTGMIADLRTHLTTQPNDTEGWALLGRTLAAQHRYQEASDAFAHATALHPETPELHMQLGETLTLAAQGIVTPQAAAEFAHAPEDPRALYYTARALAQSGNPVEARHRLLALQQEAPPDAPWRPLVQQALASLDAPPPTPSEATPALALEAHLRTNPNDAESWLALAQTYATQNDPARATATLARANQTIRGNLDLLLAYAERLAPGINTNTLPPDFIAIMHQVQALDPDQPDALWYLGLNARQNGNIQAAAANWRRLLDHLPPGSDEHAAVLQRLKSLP